MQAVTYIQRTPEEDEQRIDKAVTKAIEKYKDIEARADIRSVKAWSEHLGIDKRTIITRIEEGKIKTVFKNPYRISRYAIELAGKT